MSNPYLEDFDKLIQVSEAAMPTYKRLGYAGLLPFLAGVSLYALDVRLFDLSGDTLFIGYSAVILSFLSGTLWANSLKNNGEAFYDRELIVSNVLSLIAFLSLLLQSPLIAITLLLISYLLIFRHEARLENYAEIYPDYFSMRRNLTWIVSLLHVLLAALILVPHLLQQGA
ncbi:DUF3429 domain-containing protein [Thalassotalea mangrovi]|uniref:DUF3429 domain-containing protein n=1 Tax=Thalassotalea mangrovi TaxID=2572245 RepID=A0A4U1B682_9GAMM|nr:DUF3429 domain-containing protein [Thalassotalea mangrovi]TKB46034.1 DUF3429 domain-containing protein [Thalassotalea mangrovi]